MNVSFKEELLESLLKAKNQPYDISQLTIKHCRLDKDYIKEAEARTRIYNRVLKDLKEEGVIDFNDKLFLDYAVHQVVPGSDFPFKEKKYIVWLKHRGEIESLTLQIARNQKENIEMKVQLDKALLDLALAQSADIPNNISHRNTALIWQIVAGVSIVVAFLLKLFGVEGWL